MGNEFENGIIIPSKIKINRNYFEFKNVIGRGGFGKVWRVVFKKTQKLYALKEMSKVKIIDRKSEKSIKMERELLSKLHNPFIVNMIYAFQDFDNLYLVMDLLSGGDLRYHLCKYDVFPENQSKFFIACVILGLEYIHSNNIIHRDVKPENLVADADGYIRITDFGVAKYYHPNNSHETSGTPGYMAPEVLCAQNHSYPVDFFAIGIMGYEFMLGDRPYQGENRKEIKEEVIKWQARISRSEIPNGWSDQAANFFNMLLQRKQERRLGYKNGIVDLKNHSWFRGFNWESLAEKNMISPFRPPPSGNYDKKYCEEKDIITTETIGRYQSYIQDENFANIFKGYTFINEEDENLILNSLKNLNIRLNDNNMNNYLANQKIEGGIKSYRNKKLPIDGAGNLNNLNEIEGFNNVAFNSMNETNFNNKLNSNSNGNGQVQIHSNNKEKLLINGNSFNNFVSPKVIYKSNANSPKIQKELNINTNAKFKEWIREKNERNSKNRNLQLEAINEQGGPSNVSNATNKYFYNLQLNREKGNINKLGNIRTPQHINLQNLLINNGIYKNNIVLALSSNREEQNNNSSNHYHSNSNINVSNSMNNLNVSNKSNNMKQISGISSPQKVPGKTRNGSVNSLNLEKTSAGKSMKIMCLDNLSITNRRQNVNSNLKFNELNIINSNSSPISSKTNFRTGLRNSNSNGNMNVNLNSGNNSINNSNCSLNFLTSRTNLNKNRIENNSLSVNKGFNKTVMKGSQSAKNFSTSLPILSNNKNLGSKLDSFNSNSNSNIISNNVTSNFKEGHSSSNSNNHSILNNININLNINNINNNNFLGTGNNGKIKGNMAGNKMKKKLIFPISINNSNFYNLKNGGKLMNQIGESEGTTVYNNRFFKNLNQH